MDNNIQDPLFHKISKENRETISELAARYLLSFQDIRQCTIIARDLEMWQEGNLKDFIPLSLPATLKGKDRKRHIMSGITKEWNRLKEEPKDYSNFTPEKPGGNSSSLRIEDIDSDSGAILGDCPVSSPKTRCCQLKTLDAVIHCGYGCTYCTIQPFYHQKAVTFHRDLKTKLDGIRIDPEISYHIGTGQSSDSLMWGNKNGLLEDLTGFAKKNDNIILELKTKSENTAFLESVDIPSNVITTWSLNPDTIIMNEELGTAALDKRLRAARRIADKGNLVGFHFHPIIHFRNWEKEYGQIAEKILKMFKPEETAMISLGTVTFIKPVIKQIRMGGIASKMLQMPLEDASGKLSYTYSLKKKLIKTVYGYFSKWHDSVFFYICMESPELWKDVFSTDYDSNNEFEASMISAYMKKIRHIRNLKETPPG